MSKQRDVLSTWEWVKLGDVCDTTSGGTPSRKEPKYYGGSIHWVKSGELEYNTIIDTDEKITEEAIKASSAKIFPKGTLLIALYGATIGKLAFLGVAAATNQAICGIYENKNINSKFLFNYLFFKKQQLVKKSIGGAQPNISQSILRDLPLPLPPLPEQHRIVAKIEELLSERDKGVEALQTAQQQLKVYRQAVLKWAFEGKLTEEWRKQQKNLPPASQLLEQIKAEREEQAKATGKKLKPMASSSEAELGKLPNGWQWVNLAAVSTDIFDGPFGSHLKSSDYTDGGVRVIRLENIGALEFNDQYRSYVAKEKYETIKKHTVYPDDIIFSSFISEKIRVALVPSHIREAVNKADCFCIRTNKIIIGEKYLACFLSTRTAYHQLVNEIHGATRPRINTTQLKSCWIPYCSAEEQNQIVQEIESRLSVADKIEESITQSLKQAEALRQSILKKAFSGKLVPQDPNDEPAEKLLARIRAERTAKTPVKSSVKSRDVGRKAASSRNVAGRH